MPKPTMSESVTIECTVSAATVAFMVMCKPNYPEEPLVHIYMDSKDAIAALKFSNRNCLGEHTVCQVIAGPGMRFLSVKDDERYV